MSAWERVGHRARVHRGLRRRPPFSGTRFTYGQQVVFDRGFVTPPALAAKRRVCTERWPLVHVHHKTLCAWSEVFASALLRVLVLLVLTRASCCAMPGTGRLMFGVKESRCREWVATGCGENGVEGMHLNGDEDRGCSAPTASVCSASTTKSTHGWMLTGAHWHRHCRHWAIINPSREVSVSACSTAAVQMVDMACGPESQGSASCKNENVVRGST